MYKYIKRLIDFILSLLGTIILSPVLIAVAIAVKASSPGPVLFRQVRAGKNRIAFKIYKFRSMRSDTPSDMPTHLLHNPDAYITPVGKFLRRTSLDELPQLFNILKGDMSIVGPRPALFNQEYLLDQRDLYGANDVRPGLTGWAQVNGRDELPEDIKAKLDGEYVEKMSFAFDVKCFVRTITAVLRSDGVREGAVEDNDR